MKLRFDGCGRGRGSGDNGGGDGGGGRRVSSLQGGRWVRSAKQSGNCYAVASVQRGHCFKQSKRRKIWPCVKGSRVGLTKKWWAMGRKAVLVRNDDGGFDWVPTFRDAKAAAAAAVACGGRVIVSRAMQAAAMCSPWAMIRQRRRVVD